MVINTPFHIFFSNSKIFQLMESQPTTNNARSAILGAPGHGQPLIKMQRISINGPKCRFFFPRNFFLKGYGLKYLCNADSAIWKKRELGTIFILLALEFLIRFWIVIFENGNEKNLTSGFLFIEKSFAFHVTFILREQRINPFLLER